MATDIDVDDKFEQERDGHRGTGHDAVPSSLHRDPATLPSNLPKSNASLNDSHSLFGTSDSDDHFDGHRPHVVDLIRSRTRTRASGVSLPSPQPTPGLSRRITVLSRNEVQPFDHPLEAIPTTQDVLVTFKGPDDPYRPINWSNRKKVVTTVLYGLVTMTATWGSSSLSAGTKQVAEEFGLGMEVATLGTSLFMLGFGIGPLFWAPISEVFGRRLAVLPPMFVATCFSFAAASSKDFQALILTRFFGALFASAPVTNTGGVLGDLFSPAYRGIAMAGYSLAVVGGPTLSPIVSAALVANPSLGWRWTEYFTGILQSFMLVLAVVFIDETYPPRLLVIKARRLRHETGNWALHAKFEEWDVGIIELARKFLVRPVQLLATPICFLVATYASFVYGILYMQLGAVPIIFGEIRGWPAVTATLPFLSILVGSFAGAGINVWNQIMYNKYYRAAGCRAVPEKRLPAMMLGGCLLAAGLFITGWTADPRNGPWIAPVIGLFLTGTGFFTIFQAGLNYLVDTFQLYAASAVAANTFLRSCFAAAFPLIVTPLYHNLGVGPGSSIFGGFACLLIPVPFIFYRYGERIRAANKWSKASMAE